MLEAITTRVRGRRPAGRGDASRGPAGRGPIARIFPGDRRVWLGSLLAIVPLVVVMVVCLFQPRLTYTSTNSVGARGPAQNVAPGQTLCVPGVALAGGSGEAQISYGVTGATPTVRVTAVLRGHTLASGTYAGLPALPAGHTSIPLRPTLPAHLGDPLGSICITVIRGGIITLYGIAGQPTDGPVPLLDGQAVCAIWCFPDPATPNSVAVWLLPPHGAERTLIENWASAMRHLTIFRPGFAGNVFYWFLFLGVLPLLSYAALRLLAVAREPGRRLLIGLALISFIASASWAITTTAFDGPDESEHFAYTQYLAETGKAPSPIPNAQSIWSQDEIFALDATHHFSEIEFDDTRPPWAPGQQQIWRLRVKAQPPSRSDGGGEATATSAHSPLYYATLIPGYELGRSKGVFTELFWMRAISALFGVVVVVSAFLTMRELIPSRPELGVAAGLLIAFQPMFGFMSGVVNNDDGVNALAALAIYLSIRLLRRGFSWRLCLALGVAVGILPLMKNTGLAVAPAVGVAVLTALWRDRSLRALRDAGLAALGFIVVIGIWSFFHNHFQRTLLGLPAAAPPTPGAAVAATAGPSIASRLTYVWEIFVPWLRLPFMAQHTQAGAWQFKYIYVERGFASFGWVADYFPGWVYDVVVLVMAAAGLLALEMTRHLRRIVIRYWREAIVMMLAIIGMIAVVENEFYTVIPVPQYLTGEQGRYAFTVLVPLAALALCGLMRFKRDRAVTIAAVVVAAMICFSGASHLLYLADNFT
jgi:hypothetical protein